MTKIFISYRRQDTQAMLAIVGRIFDRLTAKFGFDRVFMDIDSIPFGVDFHHWLDAEVGRAAVVLALIGNGWLGAQDEAGRRRLDNLDDFVRIEIESALRRGILLVPVLIGGAVMPGAEQLPEPLAPLTRRNAAPVDMERDFHVHMDRLIAGLERVLLGASEMAGRIEVDAAITHYPQGRWFLPGAGKMEWFQDFDGGPEMVVVPAGEFVMGSPSDELERYVNEGPQRRVVIPRPFAVGRGAVTFAEWDAAVAAGGCGGYRPDDAGWGRGDRPVINVSWDHAQAYVQWLKGRTGKAYRLLSEVEWEYAARAGAVTPFWWGKTITPEQANYDGNYVYAGGGKGECRGKTVPVKSFAPNPWGLHQVHGNVWEWCEDAWHDDYTGAPTHGSAWTAGDGDRRDLRVHRGASWNSNPRNLRAACRHGNISAGRSRSIGFRLARTLNP